MKVQAQDVPLMPRGVRLHHDRVRDRWVLLAPERTIALDPIGYAILLEIDGTKSMQTIVATLAAKYKAPVVQIKVDVLEYVQGLSDRRILAVVA